MRSRLVTLVVCFGLALAGSAFGSGGFHHIDTVWRRR